MAAAGRKKNGRIPGGTGGRGRLHWTGGLLCGVGLILAAPTMVTLAALLLPTGLAAFADTRPGRPGMRAVLLFGLAGACQPLVLLWQSGHRIEEALAIGGDLSTIAVCWAAQAAGWLLTQIMPLVIGSLLEARARVEIGILERRRAVLLEEWKSQPIQHSR